MYFQRSIRTGMLAFNLTLGLLCCWACVTEPAAPLALLEHPERPVLSGASEIQAAVSRGDIRALVRLYARDMAEITAYARKLEAQLEAMEQQWERNKR